MSIERLRNPTVETFVFVGENRSNKAKEGNHTWQSCQKNGKPVLCAIQLWDALSGAGLDPKRQIFFNLWNDDGNPISSVPRKLKQMIDAGYEVVGMGKNVQRELSRLSIPHREMTHPAARGKIRRKDLYRKHVKEVLTGDVI
jgi:hypothetical protein